jgi:NACHT domain
LWVRVGFAPGRIKRFRLFSVNFVERECPVIPVVLPSAKETPDLPWPLKNLHYVDLRATDSHPLKRLIWGITGEKPMELSDVPSSEKPATMQDAAKCHLLPSRDDHAAAHKVRFGDPEISEARLYPPLAEPPDQEQATQLESLRRKVMEYWVDGVLKHSLHNEVLISLGKRQVDEALAAPWKYSVEVSDSTNSPPLDNRDVSAIYDATGLLLILGEPGSGKTTTLLELARTLLERARDDIKERVPVVLNLSSWKKEQPLSEWISTELSEKYWVPRKIALFWLQHGYLLPLLDALDEVETLIQSDCVAAINAFIDELTPSGLVVCCRFNEYRWLPERLKLNGAIRLEPLSQDKIAEYLTGGGPDLATLREAVNTDSVLQELAQTPLLLSIMSLASQGSGGDELARQKGDSPEERGKQIFALYVEQMFQRKGMTSLVFPKEKIIGWLSWLARKMREHSQSVFIVEGLQPNWLASTAQRGAYGTVVALSLGLIFGLSCGLISG